MAMKKIARIVLGNRVHTHFPKVNALVCIIIKNEDRLTDYVLFTRLKKIKTIVPQSSSLM